MIHRKFLSMSFDNPAFAFTRRTCIAASKTILKEFRQALSSNGPVLWIYHAFSVAAAITLSLDMIYAKSQDASSAQHESMVAEAVQNLESAGNSKIAQRGASLLSDLLKLIRSVKSGRTGTAQKRKTGQDDDAATVPNKSRRTSDMNALVGDFERRATASEQGKDECDRPPSNLTNSSWQPHQSSSQSVLDTDRTQWSANAESSAWYDVEAFAAETNNIFSTLHAGLIGANGDTFGNLLNMSHSYSFT
jgi:hypothetical protein